MATIANVLVGMKADFSDTETSLLNLISKLVRTGDEAERTGHKFHDAGEHVHNFGHGSEGVGEVFDQLRAHLADLGSEILTFGAEALALTSIFEALKEAVEVSAELESTKVALESLTGSAEQATEIIENMEQIASSQALQFTSLIPAAQRMTALGFTVEQTTESMKAAGNAAWALGTPVEAVERKLGMMAQTGRVSNLFLRTLGLSTKDLAEVMGISAGEVTKAFQALSQDARLEVMIAALGKFGDVSSKEAETVKGKWIEVKNTWHQVFVAMGDDTEDFTKLLEESVTGWGMITLSLLQKFRELGEGIAVSMTLGSSSATEAYYRVKAIMEDALQKDKEKKDKEKKPKGDLKDEVQTGLGPLRAKEAAPLQLEQIKGEEAASARRAQLDRESTEAAIKQEHLRRQAIIDLNEDANQKILQTAEEKVRVARETADKISAIDAEEARRKAAFVRAKVEPEIAQTYTPIPDETKRTNEIAKINLKAKNDIDKIVDDVVLKTKKGLDAIATAEAEAGVARAKVSFGVTKTDRAVEDIKTKSTADLLGIAYQQQKIKLEGEYEAQLSHTYAEQIANLHAIAALEQKGREAHIAGLREKLENIPESKQDDAAQKERASIRAEIAKAEADSAKAGEESANKISKADLEHLKLMREVAEIQAKTGVDTTTAKLGQEKLKNEAEYEARLAHTDEQEIAHLKEIAAIELAQRQAKIEGLQAELSRVPPGLEFDKERANLQSQISDAQEQSNTATLQSAVKITQQMEAQNKLLQAQKSIAQTLTQWKQLDVGDVARHFADAVIQLTPQIGTSLAHSLFSAPRPGQSKGAEVAQGLAQTTKSAGEQLTGKLITAAIEKLIAQIIGQAAIDALTASVTTANTAALGVATGAIVDLATAVWTQTALFGFAGGGDPDPNKPFIAGEKGPEIIKPKGSALTVIPNGQTKLLLQNGDQTSLQNIGKLPDGASDIVPHAKLVNLLQPQAGASSSGQSGPKPDLRPEGLQIHLHGAQFFGVSNTREMMRQVSAYSKLVSPKFSPATS